MSILIGIAIAAAVVFFVVTIVLVETSVRVEPGTIGLVIVRGKATGRAMTPGRHFLRPARQMMIQTYPSRELALVAGGTHQSNPDVDYVEQPVAVRLADRSAGTVSYTVRCQLIRKKVQDVHDSFGPEGIWSALRDVSRRCVIGEAAASGLTAIDVYGDGYTRLEQHIADVMAKSLEQIGFELKMFSLREVDLGETGEVVQATARSAAELEREQTLAAVRRARVDNDTALIDSVDGLDRAQLLRYRQIEAWRDLIQRWDGSSQIPAAITAQLNENSAWVSAAAQQVLTGDEEPAGGEV